MERQKAVSAHFTSKQILPFAFAEHNTLACLSVQPGEISRITHHSMTTAYIRVDGVNEDNSTRFKWHSYWERCNKSMLAYRWPSVYDAGPTLNQHWLNVSCLLRGRWRIRVCVGRGGRAQVRTLFFISVGQK